MSLTGLLTGNRATGSQGSTGQTPLDTLQDQLVDPLMSVGKPIASGLFKAVNGIKGTGESLYKAHKNWKGDESVYDLNHDTGLVSEQVRGTDTEDVNGFKQELARDDLEKGIHTGVKTVAGLGKSASKSMGGFGEVMSVGSDVLGAINPLKAASQMLSGGQKMVKGTSDIYRYQKRKNRAREGQELAEKDNNPLAMGLKNTKRNLSSSRNEALADTGIGALEGATGGLGMAQFVDPTGATFLAHKGMSGLTKIAKKIDLVRSSIKGGRKSEKVMKMREKADQGDPEAMKWMLENDPRMGSAQLLLHSQKGTEQSKSFAQEHVAKSLSLGDNGKKELGTGRLSEFDKLYSKRTGVDIESKLGHKEAAVYKAVRPLLNGAKKTWGGIKGLFGGGKKDKAPQLQNLSTNDLADQFTALTRTLDLEAEKKKGLKEGDQLSHDDMDEVWGSAKGLNQASMPNRGRTEVREYGKVKDFRLHKTHEELVDKAEQKTLKARFKGEGDGALHNMDSFDNATDAIDKTQAFVDAPEGFKDKLSALSDKGKDWAAKKIGPWAETSDMPEDIRQGIIALEQKRRDNGVTAGRNLPSTAPLNQPQPSTTGGGTTTLTGNNTPQDWVQKQTEFATAQKERRSLAKEQGQTPGQLGKVRREEEKAQAKKEKELQKQLAKEQEKLRKDQAKQQERMKKQSAPKKKGWFGRG